MKLFFFDLETTGVKYWKNGIHQISGAIEIDGEIKERFNFNVKPFKQALIEDEALAVAGISRNDLDQYSEFEKVYCEIITMLSKYVDKYDRTDKFFLVGYNNASFDNAFFRAFFVQNNDNYFGSWFWSSPIDVFVLASQHLMEDRHTMMDFKLKTVAKHLGIEIDESRLHEAQYDIDLTRQIYSLITKSQLVTQ
jgi:DNA polymerase-3 subunit epsilon